MRLSTSLLMLWSLALLGACADRDPGESVPLPDDTVPEAPDLASLPDNTMPETPDLASLPGPAGWQGDLPCARCTGIRTALVLAPDGTFRLDEGYLGLAPEVDTLFGSTGRWSWSLQSQVVVLYGSGESPRYLEAVAGGGLRALDLQGASIVSAMNYTLSPLSSVPPLSGMVRMVGAFTYFADSATMVECRSGLMLPVAMEGPYIDLERAYMASGTEPGAPMTVRVSGTLETRPAMDGPGSEVMLIVSEYGGGALDEACPAVEVRAALASGRWTLLALEGWAVGTPRAGAQSPTLEWDAEESRISGSAGCNQYSGRGFLRGTLLVAEALASTRMFCADIMETEERFLEVLSEGGAVRLEDGSLILYAGSVEVARFAR